MEHQDQADLQERLDPQDLQGPQGPQGPQEPQDRQDRQEQLHLTSTLGLVPAQ